MTAGGGACDTSKEARKKFKHYHFNTALLPDAKDDGPGVFKSRLKKKFPSMRFDSARRMSRSLVSLGSGRRRTRSKGKGESERRAGGQTSGRREANKGNTPLDVPDDAASRPPLLDQVDEKGESCVFTSSEIMRAGEEGEQEEEEEEEEQAVGATNMKEDEKREPVEEASGACLDHVEDIGELGMTHEETPEEGAVPTPSGGSDEKAGDHAAPATFLRPAVGMDEPGDEPVMISEMTMIEEGTKSEGGGENHADVMRSPSPAVL